MLYLDLKSTEDGYLRERRRAQIIVKGYSGDDENDVCLSAQCTSYSEVERDVNFLKRELDQVLAQARKQFLGEPG
jgi:hypothetical protein